MSKFLKNILLTSVLLILILLQCSVRSDCTADQIHIALGEQFYWNQPSLSSIAPPASPSIRIMFLTEPGCENSYISLEYTDSPSSTTVVQAVYTNQTIQNINWNDVVFTYDTTSERVTYSAIVHIFDLYLPPFPGQAREVSYTVHTDDKAPEQGKYKIRIPPSDPSAVGQEYIFIADFDADVSDSRSHDTWQVLKAIGADASKRETLTGVIFCGDMGYEFWQNNGDNFTKWLNDIDSLAKRYPLMMAAGNHEANFNYSFFDERIRMPLFNTNNGNRYYSWNVGPVHFIQLDLHYFNDEKTQPDPVAQQKMLEWVENDLKEADLDQNRQDRPWIIVYGHKTIYCTNAKKSGDKCNSYYPIYKQFDDLFYKYNVDLFMGAHTHTFEVLKPVAFNQTYPVTMVDDQTFKNAKAPMYVINGMAGTHTGRDDPNPDHPFLVYSSQHSSYSNLKVVSKMLLQLDFTHTPSGNIQRTFFYTKDTLRPFQQDCSVYNQSFVRSGIDTGIIKFYTKDQCETSTLIADGIQEDLIKAYHNINMVGDVYEHEMGVKNLVSLDLGLSLIGKPEDMRTFTRLNIS